MRFALTLSLAAAPLLAQAISPSHLARAHRRNDAGNQIQKRGTAGFGTWYDVGLGACGWWNNPGDFIIAMNSNQFPQDGYPSSICGKQVKITGPAGTAIATVADECPMGGGNCNWGDMDMSQGLFTAIFGDLGVGKGAMTWEWVDGSGGGSTGGGSTGGGSTGGGSTGGGDGGSGNTGGGDSGNGNNGGGDNGSGNNGGGDNGGYNGGDGNNGGNSGSGNNGGDSGSGNNGGGDSGSGNNNGGDNGGYNGGDANNGGGDNGGYNGGGNGGQQSQAPADPAPSPTDPPASPSPSPSPSQPSCRRRAPPSKA